MNPVTDVQSVTIQLGAYTFQNIGDLSRNELLHVLIWTIVVGAVGDGHAHTKGAVPCTDQQIRTGLRGGIGARRVVRRFLGEFMRVVKGKVTIDLIGADVVITHIVFTRRFQQTERALHIGFQERLRVGD